MKKIKLKIVKKYPRARLLVKEVKQKMQLNNQQIAKICGGVSISTIKNWETTGCANLSKIQPLIDLVGDVYYDTTEIKRLLIKQFEQTKENFRVYRYTLRNLMGVMVIDNDFIEELKKILIVDGYYLLEASKGDDDFFLFICMKLLNNHVKNRLTLSFFDPYYDEEYEYRPQDIGDLLIQAYKVNGVKGSNVGKRYRIRRSGLRKLFHKYILSIDDLNKLKSYMLKKGYYLIESSEPLRRDFFIVIRIKQLLHFVKHIVDEDNLTDYLKEPIEQDILDAAE